MALAGDDYARDCRVSDGSALVDTLVGYEGTYDWATTEYGSMDFVPLKETHPERSRAIDPYAHIGGNPGLVVRLVHGDDTDVAWYEVPRAVSVAFEQVLQAAGYDTELTLLEDASHSGPLPADSEVFDVMVEQALRPAE